MYRQIAQLQEQCMLTSFRVVLAAMCDLQRTECNIRY